MGAKENIDVQTPHESIFVTLRPQFATGVGVPDGLSFLIRTSVLPDRCPIAYHRYRWTL